MDDKKANIDLVFRNGLKDFEILPPPEVWDNIHPVIKAKQGPFILIRAAAIITVVLSMSFFAYRLSRELSTELDSSIMALNMEAAYPLTSSSVAIPFSVLSKENKPFNVSSEESKTNIPVIDLKPESEENTSPEVAYLQQSKSLSMRRDMPEHELLLVALNSKRNFTFDIKVPEQIYFPENSTVETTDRWSIAALASPTYYSRFNSGTDELSKQIIASEHPLVSYSGGIAFSYKINKRFSIQSGLYYSSVGQVVGGISSFGGFQKYVNTKGDHNFEVLTTNGSVYTNNSDVFLVAVGPGERVLSNYSNDVFDPKKASLQYINNTLHQNFSYLELPVLMRYKFIDKGIDVNLIGGVSYNMLVNNSVYTINDGSKYRIGTTEGLNQISLSSSLGMGMEYSFSENLSLNLEPTFRYYLNPFNEITGSKIHPYSFGIFSGVSYKF